MAQSFFKGGHCQEMPPSHALVYLCLCHLAKDGVATVSKLDLISYTGLGNECIRRAINHLEARRYLVKRQTGGRKPNSYTLLDLEKVQWEE